ncbi:MAG: class I SAM-dependent DNA methyltransferase [Kiritimatiellaceae bacterium]|nr:class I SAM-dependent DNA methyltransferase [Kiritimatiellaceae bacterium]
MSNPKSEKLAAFVTWTQAHITGDEKGQAQIFLDRLFQAFGHAGSLDVGGEAECRVRKAKEDGGGVSFADYVWKPVVLIEMKKRGVDLSKHYRQAFDYWTRLVPGRPRYVVLCNFDEFHVYDFETQMDSPVGRVTLAELPERWGPLNFLFPGQPKPLFDNDRVAVTREAADRLAYCFKKFRNRGVDQPTAQRFILQMLVALFAEDIDLLPKYFVTQLLNDISTPTDSYDLLGGLFDAMNTTPAVSGGRFKGVPYFNGGLFAAPARIELKDLELVALREAAKFDWKKVQPEIFGTLFEHSLDDGTVEGTRNERRAQGAHFTHPADIMKIIGPTIVHPWHEQIEEAKTFKRLRELRDRMQTFCVLDPACGSGNFLYIAYRELKRLEARIYERIDSEFPKHASDTEGQMRFSYLTARNFYGMDINPFAVEIAKVTMMIARKLAIDELHISERALPLDNLDRNFIATDALITAGADGAFIRTPWPRADVIVGNPPFIGAKLLKPQLGPDYVEHVRALYPEVPGMADYCVYWFRRAHDHLPACTAADPMAGRAGLVGTQNIRNNQSRVGGLDHVVSDGTIVEAVDNQPWSGEANVHVSIANWAKTQDLALLPKTKRLWFKVEPTAAAKKLRKNEGKSATKDYELNFREVPQINSAISDQTDVSAAHRLECNFVPQKCFAGQVPRHHGFVLTPEEASNLLKVNPRNAEVVHPFFIGDELVTSGKPERWIIDFQQMNILDAKSYEAPFARVEATVLPHIQEYAERERGETGKDKGQDQTWLKTWWQHFRCRKEMVDSINRLSRYIACPEIIKRPTFAFVHPTIRPDHRLRVFAFDDDYSYGILQAHPHWLWFLTKSSKLTERLTYTSSSVFDTFPWPQTPSTKQIEAVAAAGREVRRIRAETLPKMKGGLRALYRTLELPGANPLKDAHAALDAAVLAAYGFSAKADLLAQLLELNQQVAGKIEAGETVTAPGIPASYPTPAGLITGDCIRP